MILKEFYYFMFNIVLILIFVKKIWNCNNDFLILIIKLFMLVLIFYGVNLIVLVLVRILNFYNVIGFCLIFKIVYKNNLYVLFSFNKNWYLEYVNIFYIFCIGYRRFII